MVAQVSVPERIRVRTIAQVLERFRAGEAVGFGPNVVLDKEGLVVEGQTVPLNIMRSVSLDDNSDIVITRLGAEEPILTLPSEEVEDVGLLIEVVNRLVREVPYVQRRTVTGWPPGSIGDLSARLGYDMRELLMAGYSHQQIRGALAGEYTLDELLKRRPERRRQRRRRKRP